MCGRILQKNDKPWFPQGHQKCLVCGLKRENWRGFAYISGGASFVDEQHEDDLDPAQFGALLQAFLSIGFHFNSTEIKAGVDADIELVRELIGGQFDIGFCSLQCLKQWFCSLIDELAVQTNAEPELFADAEHATDRAGEV